MDDTLIKENILKTLLYYYIFNHPLTLDEIYLFHQSTNISKHKIKRVLSDIVSEKHSIIGELNGFYYILPNKCHAEERLVKEKISNRFWKIARVMSYVIKCFPFVRGVFVTGTLSKNSSAMDSDIDFMVVCKEKRLWIARTLLRLFSRIFLLNNNKYLCINYFISENNLTIDDKNLFTATELAHIKVLYNTKMLDRFIQSNKWVERYFPNYPVADGSYHFPMPKFLTSDARSILQPVFEMFFPGKFGDKLDDFLRMQSQRRLKKKFTDYANLEQKQSLILTAGVSKMHGTMVCDHKRNILEKYYALLRKYHVFNLKDFESVALDNI